MADDTEMFDPRDLDELIALEADDPGLLRDLIADYLVKSAEIISKLKQFDSLRETESAAHTLKSSSALLGLRATARWAAALEEAARNETPDLTLLPKIESAWLAGCRLLKGFRDVKNT